MEQTMISRAMQDAIYTILITSAPMLGVGLVVGLVISIFQATTQIHEQTLAFVPKIIAIFLSILVFGGFILSTLTDFFQRLFGYMLNLT